MFVLVVNAGSSSLKYQLFDMDNESVIAKGNCENIGIGGRHTHTVVGREKVVTETEIANHSQAVGMVIKALTDKKNGCISDMSQIAAVGHRIVHGGPWLVKSVRVDDKVLADLEKCRDIAPLHTGPHLMGIRGCLEVMPNIPQVIVMDTAFHQTMPAEAYTYPIPYELAEKHKIRRYGFHGTSHRYVSGKALEYLGDPNAKVVTCHLGNGSSICAVNAGKCVDTSMGFTPLEGVIMGSRCGAVDPAIIPFLMEKENIPASEMCNWMNKKCGFLGVSGVSSDLRQVCAAAGEGNERARLSINILAYQVRKYIGSYTAAMNGLDCLVFTAGIGENNAMIRRLSCENMSFFGIEIDNAKNEAKDPFEIHSANSRVKILVIPTNEELVIARDTLSLVNG